MTVFCVLGPLTDELIMLIAISYVLLGLMHSVAPGAAVACLASAAGEGGQALPSTTDDEKASDRRRRLHDEYCAALDS